MMWGSRNMVLLNSPVLSLPPFLLVSSFFFPPSLSFEFMIFAFSPQNLYELIIPQTLHQISHLSALVTVQLLFSSQYLKPPHAS